MLNEFPFFSCVKTRQFSAFARHEYARRWPSLSAPLPVCVILNIWIARMELIRLPKAASSNRHLLMFKLQSIKTVLQNPLNWWLAWRHLFYVKTVHQRARHHCVRDGPFCFAVAPKCAIKRICDCKSLLRLIAPDNLVSTNFTIRYRSRITANCNRLGCSLIFIQILNLKKEPATGKLAITSVKAPLTSRPTKPAMTYWRLITTIIIAIIITHSPIRLLWSFSVLVWSFYWPSASRGVAFFSGNKSTETIYFRHRPLDVIRCTLS